MFLPDLEGKMIYTYSSNIITINLTLSMEKFKDDYRMYILEGPFIGKYHALLKEDKDEIEVISFGKGLYYGGAGSLSMIKAMFTINKNNIIENELKINNNYILRCNKKNTTLRLFSKTYEECMSFSLVYENGKYIIYIKEGLGILMIRNIKNDRILEEIFVKET